MGTRHTLRISLERVAARLGARSGWTARQLTRPRIQVLCLHSINRDTEPAFRSFIAHLSERYRLISYSDAVSRMIDGKIDAGFVALTFDDGLKDHLRAGRILSEMGVSACFFVCPSIIGETNPQRTASFCADRLGIAATQFLAWKDLDTLRAAGHEIGSHSMAHKDLSTISNDEAARDIAESMAILNERVGPVKHFAWPYGRFSRMTAAGVRCVFESGFGSCASAERGCHTVCADSPRSLCIRREPIDVLWNPGYWDFLFAKNVALAGAGRWPRRWRRMIETENEEEDQIAH